MPVMGGVEINGFVEDGDGRYGRYPVLKMAYPIKRLGENAP
jgi:hypothetical protein